MTSETTAPGKAAATTLRAGLKPPRQERSEATLKALLSAGRTLINEAGDLGGFSLAGLTRAAGTSVGAFYARFPDKETFCALVLEDTLAELRAALDLSLATDPVWATGPAAAICARIVGFYIDLFRKHRGLFAAYMRHGPAQNPLWRPIREANQRILDAMVPRLARHVDATRFTGPDDETRIAVQLVVSALTNIVLHAPGGLDLYDPRLEQRLAEMLHRYLALPAGGQA
ncbi:TetR/AcrR family transcriptional regulator [Cupriavidus basilensis]|uniref:TetR/AcrR family transcriptional regulator n=1 Tax=Cupriavidus basilensis TaxID=68895 RepID=A0ABT6AW39_9BURK|nr:TetR/AcrR family transcriptional regulator [Cupriavidus basilensis]MDF3836457.1 TetR/AcrR family transcriptional regulator [Cupriavidus basilensis]